MDSVETELDLEIGCSGSILSVSRLALFFMIHKSFPDFFFLDLSLVLFSSQLKGTPLQLELVLQVMFLADWFLCHPFWNHIREKESPNNL